MPFVKLKLKGNHLNLETDKAPTDRIIPVAASRNDEIGKDIRRRHFHGGFKDISPLVTQNVDRNKSRLIAN